MYYTHFNTYYNRLHLWQHVFQSITTPNTIYNPVGAWKKESCRVWDELVLTRKMLTALPAHTASLPAHAAHAALSLPGTKGTEQGDGWLTRGMSFGHFANTEDDTPLILPQIIAYYIMTITIHFRAYSLCYNSSNNLQLQCYLKPDLKLLECYMLSF